MKHAPADLLPEEEDLLRQLSSARRSCPDPARLQAAAAGVLPEPAAREVRAHVADCAACATLAADLATWEGPDLSAHEEQRIWQRLRRQTGGARTARPTARRWVWAAAAAVFAAAVPAYILVQGTNVPPSPAPSGSGGSPSPALVLPLDKLGLRTPPGAALVWRDAGPSFERELGQALAPYQAGDLEEAARRLDALGARYPRAAAAPLYRGVALLLLGRPAEAVSALTAARERATAFWMPHAQWYLAVAVERAGDTARAAALLRELCGGGSEYDARACAAARTLDGRRR